MQYMRMSKCEDRPDTTKSGGKSKGLSPTLNLAIQVESL